MERPRTTFCNLPKFEVAMLADAVRPLRQREARGVPVDLRSVDNLRRLDMALRRSR